MNTSDLKVTNKDNKCALQPCALRLVKVNLLLISYLLTLSRNITQMKNLSFKSCHTVCAVALELGGPRI